MFPLSLTKKTEKNRAKKLHQTTLNLGGSSFILTQAKPNTLDVETLELEPNSNKIKHTRPGPDPICIFLKTYWNLS